MTTEERPMTTTYEPTIITPVGSSWPGLGDHTGHLVTKIEEWEPRFEHATVVYTNLDMLTDAVIMYDKGVVGEILVDGEVIPLGDREVSIITGAELTCGSVRCSCGEEWKVGGWPYKTNVLS